MALHLINFKYTVAKQPKEGYCLCNISELDLQRKIDKAIIEKQEPLSYADFVKESITKEIDQTINTNYTDLIITTITRI